MIKMEACLFLTTLFAVVILTRGADAQQKNGESVTQDMQQLLLATLNRLEKVETLVMEKEEEIKSLQITVATQQKQLENQQKVFTEEISTLQRDLILGKYTNYTTRETSDTVFLATISARELPITDDEVIIWDTAPINPGGHYNTILGAYTAPYNGYYQFSVTKRSNDARSYFWILLDDQRYAYFYLPSSGSTPTGSTTINLQLTAGQIVRVENDHSSIIYGTTFAGEIQSWFTGHMLYAL